MVSNEIYMCDRFVVFVALFVVLYDLFVYVFVVDVLCLKRWINYFVIFCVKVISLKVE